MNTYECIYIDIHHKHENKNRCQNDSGIGCIKSGFILSFQHTHTHAHILRVFTCVCACVGMYTCTHACMCLYALERQSNAFCVCVRVCLRVCVYACVHMHIYTYKYIIHKKNENRCQNDSGMGCASNAAVYCLSNTYTHMHAFTHTYAHMHTCAHTRTHMHTGTHIHKYTPSCIHIQAHTHTHPVCVQVSKPLK